MVTILIKASIVIIVLLAFYKFFLEKESFFAANRIYLLSCVILAFSLPFIVLPKMIEQQGIIDALIDPNHNQEIVYNTNTIQDAENQNAQSDDNLSNAEKSNLDKYNVGSRNTITNFIIKDGQLKSNGLLFWLMIVYFFGVIILSVKFLVQISSIIWKILRKDDVIIDEGYTLVNVGNGTEPCSFFKYIFINPNNYDLQTYNYIIDHEKIHVNKRHTIDLLLTELAVIVLWFNPFVWVLRKEVEKNIEYQTDNLMVKGDTKVKENYQLNLLKIGTYTKPLSITTNYNQSLIKQRILKMNGKKSNNHSYLKYPFIAPLLFMLLLFLNEPRIGNSQNVLFPTSLDNSSADSLKNKGNNCEELINAIKVQDYSAIVELLKIIFPNCREPFGSGLYYDYQRFEAKGVTPLTATAKIGNEKIANILLKVGAQIDFQDGNGITPLIMASHAGHLEFVKFLVEKGADINLMTSLHGSAINQAALGGYLEIVRYLLEQGADINAATINEANPLGNAAGNGHNKTVTFLIDKGAKIDLKDDNSYSVLCMAAKRGHIKTLELLLSKGGDVNFHTDRKWSALHGATSQGQNKTVEFLLSKGANIDTQIHGETPLILAVRNGLYETTKLLLAKGAAIDLQTKKEGTALNKAARSGKNDIVELLLANGANINMKTDAYGTALNAATTNGHLETVKLLLEKGADVKIRRY